MKTQVQFLSAFFVFKYVFFFFFSKLIQIENKQRLGLTRVEHEHGLKLTKQQYINKYRQKKKKKRAIYTQRLMTNKEQPRTIRQ